MNVSPRVTFSIYGPGRRALGIMRRALALHRLRTASELDVALRIKQELVAGLAPCIVLSVDDPALLLEGVVFHRGAALEIPQPVVVAGGEHRTQVLVRSAESLMARGLPTGLRDPVLELQARIVRAMGTVAVVGTAGCSAADL